MRFFIHSLRVRLRALLHRSAMERDLDEELEFHVEQEAARNLARGMSESEAVAAARRDLGDATAHREDAWEAFGWRGLEELVQDVRYGSRVLRRNPGFAAVTIGVLAMGIGASTIIFSAINGVLLKPLPYTDPNRLVALRESNPDARGARSGTSVWTFATWSERSRSFEKFAAYRPWGFDLSGAAEPERLRGARVSGDLFSLLGVGPLLGRTLLADDGAPGRTKAVLLSEELWRRRFAADARILGGPLVLNGETYTVVGVVPGGFSLPQVDLWVPLTFAPYEMDQRGNRALAVIGRMKRDVDFGAARGELLAMADDLGREFPESHAGWSVSMTPLKDDLTGSVRKPLWLLFAAAFLVLLVACANTTNLLLARSVGRRREVAMRTALGATRLRIARQLAAEHLLIAGLAGAAGLVLAVASTAFINHAEIPWLPRAGEIHVDGAVLGFALLLSLMTALGLAVIASWDATRLDRHGVIKAGSASEDPRFRTAWRDLPVVGQVAMALLLLVSGGLLLRSFQRAQSVDLGFSPGHVLSMTISLPEYRYPTPAQKAVFFENLRWRVASLPGARSAGLVSHPPLTGPMLTGDFTLDAPPHDGLAQAPTAQLVDVTPGYFEALRIPIRKGRAFTDEDRADRPGAVIIDETLARRFWPAGDVVGRRLRLGVTLGADSSWREIVGVVGGVRSVSPERGAEPTIYFPHSQNPWPTMGLVIRTAGDPEAVTRAAIAAVRGLDPNQAVQNVRPFENVVARTLAARRAQTFFMTASAAVAFLLAILGVYGMVAYAVAQRRRELGIRAALGAGPRDIVWLCVRRGLARVGFGMLLGSASALALTGLFRSLLFGQDPWDPITFLGAILLVGAAGVLACHLPATRAARAQPFGALRVD